jgi:hypothetical protein
MLAVLGGLAGAERDLIRTRTAEGRSRAKAQGRQMRRPYSHNSAAERGHRTARAGRDARRTRPQLQCKPSHDFEADGLEPRSMTISYLVGFFLPIVGVVLLIFSLNMLQSSVSIPLPEPDDNDANTREDAHKFPATSVAQFWYPQRSRPSRYFPRRSTSHSVPGRPRLLIGGQTGCGAEARPHQAEGPSRARLERPMGQG